jgi:hypothetical protein
MAYFTSTQQLTDFASEDSDPGDTALGTGCRQAIGPNGCNLYLYDFNAPEGQRLSAVSAGDSSGNGPQVQGVMAISADGSHAYFVAKGVLTAGKNAEGNQPTPGADNLYLYERDAAHPGGRLVFIASLSVSGADADQWIQGPTVANVTPTGGFLVFGSTAALTPNTAPSGVFQLFRYDAGAEALTRLSIGQRGFNDNGNRFTEPFCEGLSGQCPEAAQVSRPQFFFASAGPLRRDPSMSHDGRRAFFTSPLALTPGALDQVQIATGAQGPIFARNLYQWEAQGAGSCEEAGGCVRLVSDGRDTTLSASGVCGVASAVCLIGASAEGRDVFFASANRLVPSDTDTQVDYYDARVEGGFAEPPHPLPCQGDTCPDPGTGPAPAQNHGSAGFEGKEEGPKHPVKPRKHKKHHRSKHKRTNADRRAGK